MRMPDFWSKRNSLSALLLAPAGALYGYATSRRLSRGVPWRAPIPAICVGNVTAGGSGKTPTVQALARRAVERGIAVHCLSRGYGGRLAGPVLVDPARHDARDVGDEPLLLAALAPTWIARDRAAGAKAAVAGGAKLLLLDDGLQNPALVYDLSLLVIDGGFGFGNGRIIPAGPLREPLQAAVTRVGAVVLIGEDSRNSLGHLPVGLPVIRARIMPPPDGGGREAYGVAVSRTGEDNRRVVAFAGLGRPMKFYDTLAATGAEIVGWFPFPDHHRFTADDLKTLRQAAEATQGQLITTAKDFVRLPPAFRDAVQVLAVDLMPDDPGAWDDLLDRVLV